ncbi:hypothetical protein ACFV0R_27835 [Streptomyces sp. NPDC059578]|uniref:hypothetical protein n=1 Tax=Streptomyces sp. NPDC059578 TaxID=3346874 RepID=UPI0036A70458
MTPDDRDPAEGDAPEQPPAPRRKAAAPRKQVLLRLDPLVYEALARWAGAELRSANAQIEFLLRKALKEAGRFPGSAGPIARRGRPPGSSDAPGD